MPFPSLRTLDGTAEFKAEIVEVCRRRDRHMQFRLTVWKGIFGRFPE
jgi:hypothetical protein